jgi:hypothetical protein
MTGLLMGKCDRLNDSLAELFSSNHPAKKIIQPGIETHPVILQSRKSCQKRTAFQNSLRFSRIACANDDGTRRGIRTPDQLGVNEPLYR